MPQASIPAVEIAGVIRDYRGLRPLRLAALSIGEGERVAVTGVDAIAAEVLVNLVTGASLPDQGDVRVFGRSTAAIADGDEWLASLDRYGLVSPRAVLMDSATVEQNLAMPFTLEIDPVPPDVARRVRALAIECGFEGEGAGAGVEDVLRIQAGRASAAARARLHFARAIALDPALVVLEHPTAALPDAAARRRYAGDVARVLEARRLTALIITEDEPFARRIAGRTLKLNPATGELKPVKRGWFRY